ncbi:FAD-dependent oxidoreductase [Aureliella helgolandensis]|uniref:NADH dehydrogenase-like protein YjlD n=1 Tax=Aureliella helgolandensis TaxID=2527968 RepID=A0A518G7F6_9BACT|nr:FAD-dependent oxidoreductase [Aureliella helgolandensis]QDV24518.1 NADH dehydrogenase-like protein YjlD [Aureliella helgolandensis]
MSCDDSGPRRKRIVLLGIGHTNAHVLKEWASAPIPNCDLVCVSNYPTATYSGMLPGTLGSQFSDDEMRIDLRSLAEQGGAELVLAETSGISLPSGEILFSDRAPIKFDALSIGVGSMPVGWEQHSASPLLVPIKPMQTFLERLNTRLTHCSSAKKTPLRVAIVGGGVASVEIAFCLLQQCRRRERAGEFSIEIFTSSESVCEGMHSRSIGRIQRLLTSRGIGITAGQRVTKVDDSGLTTEDGSRHAVDAVIWATGAAAPPVLAKLALQTDERGFIATGKTLQSLSDPRIFAVGDSGTMIESPCPKAGVYAVRQCPILSHNLRAYLGGGDLRDFVPQGSFLKILNTGDGKAFLEYGWLSAHARWCWTLKTWIDRKFVQEFRTES